MLFRDKRKFYDKVTALIDCGSTPVKPTSRVTTSATASDSGARSASTGGSDVGPGKIYPTKEARCASYAKQPQYDRARCTSEEHSKNYMWWESRLGMSDNWPCGGVCLAKDGVEGVDDECAGRQPEAIGGSPSTDDTGDLE